VGTLLRLGPYRIMIYTLDHGPVTPLDALGIDSATLRQAVRLITENLLQLCEAWRSLHGAY